MDALNTSASGEQFDADMVWFSAARTTSAKLWAALGRPSAVLTTLRVARSAGGMSQRAIARALDNALGQYGVSQSRVRGPCKWRGHCVSARARRIGRMAVPARPQ